MKQWQLQKKKWIRRRHLTKNDLIRPTINWLSDDENSKRSKEDIRFVFTDELLRELIEKIWMIQESRLELLRFKMNDLLEAPMKTRYK